MRKMIEQRADRAAGTAALPMRDALVESFFQTLLDGLLHSESVLRNRLLTLGLPLTADTPCLLLTLRLENGERYLQEVWRYGRARLAMALRKFFQAETDDIYYTLSGLRAGCMRLLACPLRPLPARVLEETATAHIQRESARIAEFLELEVTLEEVRVLDGLKGLLKPGASV
jgi:hypothetical protein